MNQGRQEPDQRGELASRPRPPGEQAGVVRNTAPRDAAGGGAPAEPAAAEAGQDTYAASEPVLGRDNGDERADPATSTNGAAPATGADTATDLHSETEGAASSRPQARADSRGVQASAPAPTGAPPAPDGAGPRPYSSERKRPAGWRLRKLRHLPRLRIGWHTASDDALDRLHITASSFGVVLGRYQSGSPAALGLFQPEPLSGVLVGGLWSAKLLATRCLDFGSRIAIETHDAANWAEIRGRRDRAGVLRVTAHPPGAGDRMVASADAPVLRLHDLPESSSKPARSGDSSWQTDLSVLRTITRPQVDRLPRPDILLTQRLTAEESHVIAALLELERDTVDTLQLMHDDMLAVWTGTGMRYVWLEPTGNELDRLGRPGRY